MQVSVEKTSELSRKMTVTIPEEVFQEKLENKFKSLAREIKLDGFRPGKVPVSVIKKQFGERVKGEVQGDLIQSTYFDAIEQEKLIPAGHPHIHPAENTDGFCYVAEFEVYPEVSLDGIDQLQINRVNAEVTDADIDQMISKLKEQRKEWSAVERPAQQKDRVTIRFSGECDGENFTEGTVEDFQVEIGAKDMIGGFEDELVGLSANDRKSFDIQFPENYSSPKLAGKLAHFEVEAVKVEAPVYPEVDAEFMQAYGVEQGDMQAFRQQVKANMERELEQGLKAKLKQAAMDELVAKIDVSVPKILIDNEIQELIKPYEQNAKQQGLSLDQMDLPQDVFEERATSRVKLGLIMGEIIKRHNLKAEADRVRGAVERLANSYEKPEEVVNWYYSDEQRLREIQQMVLEEEVVDWVVGQSTVIDETVSFDDVMNNNK